MHTTEVLSAWLEGFKNLSAPPKVLVGHLFDGLILGCVVRAREIDAGQDLQFPEFSRLNFY